MKHDPIPTNEVLDWLAEHHPDLVDHAEIDRAWTWLVVDLRDKPDVRKSLKEFGFVFARRGHPLPSGATGTWGHSCDVPLPFKRRRRHGEGSAAAKPKPERKRERPAQGIRPQATAVGQPGRYDPLAGTPNPSVPATQAARPVSKPSEEIDPEVLAFIS